MKRALPVASRENMKSNNEVKWQFEIPWLLTAVQIFSDTKSHRSVISLAVVWTRSWARRTVRREITQWGGQIFSPFLEKPRLFDFSVSFSNHLSFLDHAILFLSCLFPALICRRISTLPSQRTRHASCVLFLVCFFESLLHSDLCHPRFSDSAHLSFLHIKFRIQHGLSSVSVRFGALCHGSCHFLALIIFLFEAASWVNNTFPFHSMNYCPRFCSHLLSFQGLGARGRRSHRRQWHYHDWLHLNHFVWRSEQLRWNYHF